MLPKPGTRNRHDCMPLIVLWRTKEDDHVLCLDRQPGVPLCRLCHSRPPNGSRLSCGAKLECSQPEFYNTACKTFSGSIGDGRRQLQALVRLRTTSHSSGPSSPGTQRGTDRRLPPMEL